MRSREGGVIGGVVVVQWDVDGDWLICNVYEQAFKEREE